MTMTLTQLANESNKQDDDKRRAAREEQRRKIMANAEAKIIKGTGSLGVTPVFLDSQVETTLTVYRRGSFDESRAQEQHRVYRYRVDDVVLRAQAGSRGYSASGTYSPEMGYLALERDCGCCGRTTGVELHVYGGRDPDRDAKEFVRQLGIALRTPVTCTFCAAEVSQPCPTCGHAAR
jgi:hypothetical protein